MDSQQIQQDIKDPAEESVTKYGEMNKEVDRYLNKNTVTPPSQEKKFEELFDMQYIKDLDDKDFKRIDEELAKYGQSDNKELRYAFINKENDIKKQQRLVSAREMELQNAKKAPLEYTEFIEGLKKDFKGTYENYKDKFGLPDTDFVTKQVTGQSVSERLSEWQDKELVPLLTKRFKLEEDEFAYDSSDAYKANTPSYEYRVQTEKKERELSSEYETLMSKQKEQLETIAKRKDEALQYLQDNYFAGNNEEFTAYLEKLDGMSDKMKEGNFNADANPFDIVNIFRGVFFDDLVNKKVKEITGQLHKAYNEKGMYLPSVDTPLDVTSVKSSTSLVQTPTTTKKQFGRLHTELNKYK